MAEQTAEQRQRSGTMAPVSLLLAGLLVTMWMLVSASDDLEQQQQQEKEGELTLHLARPGA